MKVLKLPKAIWLYADATSQYLIKSHDFGNDTRKVEFITNHPSTSYYKTVRYFYVPAVLVAPFISTMVAILEHMNVLDTVTFTQTVASMDKYVPPAAEFHSYEYRQVDHTALQKIIKHELRWRVTHP